MAVSVGTAQATLSSSSHADVGGYLDIPATPIEFALGTNDIPGPGEATTVMAASGSPFEMSVATALPGRWLLEVEFSEPLRLQNALSTIPDSNLEISAEPSRSSSAASCPPIPWTPVGSGAQLAVLSGTTICRYHTRLRLRFTGENPSGSFTGTLRWTLSRDSP